MLYNVIHILSLYIVLLYYGMKKDKHFSFRTTEQNLNYLKLIAESDDRTPSYILNKMIDAFRERGCFMVEQIK